MDMYRRAITAALLASSLLVISCNKNQPEVTGPAYLYATPGSLTVVAGRETSATVAGGQPPYYIVRHAKSPYAHDSLQGNTLTVYGDVPGGTSAVLGDASTPQKTLDVPITIVKPMPELNRPAASGSPGGLIRSALPLLLVLFFVCGSGALGQHRSKKPKNAQKSPASAVSFKKNITPILKTYCLPCHTEDQMNPSELYLDSYESLMKGGKHGRPLVPGNPDSSLILLKLGPKPPFGDPMPLKRKSPISDDTLAIIRKWISQGAKNN